MLWDAKNNNNSNINLKRNENLFLFHKLCDIQINFPFECVDLYANNYKLQYT